MPTSLIIVALVVAWLLVLVPIVARRRQEVAQTADSTLAARVVRSGGADDEAGGAGRDAVPADVGSHQVTADVDEDDFADEGDDAVVGRADEDRSDDVTELGSGGAEDGAYEERPARPYRPGRGGFNPEAAAIAARAKYSFRQRVVLCMLLTAAATALLAVIAMPMLWWAHAGVDIILVGYLTYLRRQVRIEEEIRQRRTMRMAAARRVYVPADDEVEDDVDEVKPVPRRPEPARVHRPGTVVVDMDDDDPMFAELERPDVLPYRRAVGE